MNWVDGVILAVLGLSILVGLFRGLVAEVLSLVIWIVAFWVMWAFGPVVSASLEHSIAMPTVRAWVAYGGCFVVVLILGALLKFALRRLIWGIGLSGIDRLFGMLFGFVRGVLIVTLIAFLVGLTGFTRDDGWRQSALLPQFREVAAWLGQSIPPGVVASVRDKVQPEKVLDKLHAEKVLNHLHSDTLRRHLPSLSGTTRAPMLRDGSTPGVDRSVSLPSAPAHPGTLHSTNF